MIPKERTDVSNGSKSSTAQPETRPEVSLPPWARPIVRVCDTVYPFFLSLAIVTFILLFAMIALKRTDLSWIHNLVGAFGFFTSLGLLALLIAEFQSIYPGWIVAVLGIGLYYAPLLLAQLVVRVALPTTALNTQLLAQMTATFKNLGIYAVAIAIITLMVGYIRHFMRQEAKRRNIRFKYVDNTAKNVERPGLIPKCWQMSRCRPSVRMSCPNYIEHVTCWKRRSGCFCDRDLANHLIASSGRGEAQEAIEMQQTVGGARPARDKSRQRSWKEHKRYCLTCPLYVEHQEYKYRHYHWTSFLATGVIVAGGYRFFDIGYKWSVQFLDGLLKNVAHIPGVSADTSLANSPFEYILLAVFSLLLLSYVIGLMDKIFLEWKL